MLVVLEAVLLAPKGNEEAEMPVELVERLCKPVEVQIDSGNVAVGPALDQRCGKSYCYASAVRMRRKECTLMLLYETGLVTWVLAVQRHHSALLQVVVVVVISRWIRRKRELTVAALEYVGECWLGSA